MRRSAFIDGSTVQETLVSGTTNDGVYTWMVPDIDTSTAVIQVVGTDLVEALATDASDEYFSRRAGHEAYTIDLDMVELAEADAYV